MEADKVERDCWRRGGAIARGAGCRCYEGEKRKWREDSTGDGQRERVTWMSERDK